MIPAKQERDRESRLRERMAAAGLREEDIEETFVRSSGHGGQNVNKTSTCVVLVHRPTGLQIRCQSSRQQGMNRFIARCLLVARLEEQRRAAAATRRAEQEKARRRNRPRSRASKGRTLADKAHQSQKKAGRRASLAEG